MARKKPSVTQKNIDKINRNIQAIARVFGTNSKPYDIATSKIFLAGLATYDKKGVVQVQNTKANRAKHQKIKKIASERKSVNIWKRKYGPPKDLQEEYDDMQEGPDIFDGIGGDSEGPAPHKETFTEWYSRISNDFFDLVDEVYACMDGCDFFNIPYNKYDVWNDEEYRMSLYEKIYEQLISDTDKAREFYNKYGYGLAEDTGEVTTSTNTNNAASNTINVLLDENTDLFGDPADYDIDLDY